MNAKIESNPGSAKNRTTVERASDRELLERWWVPKSMGMKLLACEVDARVGGKYRLVFDHSPEPIAFFGTYVEVKPHSRLAWTNEEGGEGGGGDDGDLRGKGRQDAGGPAGELSFEGSVRHLRRSDRCHGRDVRSAGR